MKQVLQTHSLADMVTLFSHVPELYQPYHFYDGLIFHTRKSLVNPDKCFLYLENDLGIHYLGICSSKPEEICLEILEFVTEIQGRI